MSPAMAAAPEEFLSVHPEPPSPSVFLDLPPTPPPHDDPAGAFDDMALPYIARLLMDEEAADEASFFYQYPDHPALLKAQLPFAQILSGAAAPDDDDSGNTTTSPSFSADTDTRGTSSPGGRGGSDSDHSPTLTSPSTSFIPAADDADMVTSAFLKGMEEGTKFLPTNDAIFLLDNTRLDARGRKNSRHNASPETEARRATKLMAAPEPLDASDARKMFDEMMLGERDISMKGVEQQQQRVIADTANHKAAPRRRRRRTSNSNSTNNNEAVDLHALLLRCAQSVSTDDRRGAQDLLAQVRRHSSATGDAAQRLAHCFAEGLEARLAGTGSRLYNSLMLQPTSAVDFLKAYQLFMAACCCKKVAFAFSNKTIFDAVAGRRRLHIVDYGIGYGFQWPGLLRGLAARHGGPPEVRITGIDLPQPGFRPAHQIDETGRRLMNCARELGVPFRFRGIAAKREAISPDDLDLGMADDDEVLVVSSLCHFRHLMDESVVAGRPSPRDQVLGNIRRMRPDVFIHGVINGGYGSTYFPTRFRELLFFCAAHFDLLDATVPRDSPERLLIERDILGRGAMNVIACEGADRVERPETYRQWQARNQRAGLRQLPLRPEVVKVVLDKVRDNYHKDFVVDEDQAWLLHRWKGRVLYGLSTWVAQR
ncbi:scarecrow-like protein 9 [Setaria italica]|uniref:scarecrow-like protein 9 n=1 Tax=Setaria italica TaxID=4555 RepID=UPI000BE4B5AA|nr:scarecrow-like protein 9 [Setaria italica]